MPRPDGRVNLRVGIDFDENANLGVADGVDEDEELDEDDGLDEDADPDEDEDEDTDMTDFVDILDVLDGKAEAYNGSDSEEAEDTPHSERRANERGKASGDKRKAPHGTDGDLADPRAPKRKMIKERTEAGVENEFHAPASGSKLKLDDLLAPLGSHSSNLLALEKSTKVLASSSAQLLAAPLPHRAQERLGREAAYEQTKEEVDKWTATMKRIKEAEHLSFPLQAQPIGRISNSELAAKFKPTTELESSIDKLLKTANMREADIEKMEELQMSHLPAKEVAARRSELLKMRQLTFRHTGKSALKPTDPPARSATLDSQDTEVPEAPEGAPTSNPWIASGEITMKAPRRKNEVVVGKGSAVAEKSKNRLKKRTKKHDEERKKAEEDATVEISTTDVLTLSGEAKGPKAFEQRDLVALAFAGDNVVQDFQAAKRREIAADAPREVDTTLPGWGSWGGSGTRKQPPKPHLIKQVPGIDPRSRADFNKSHVIISERRDKKAAKYLVNDLPYPYTSKAQFERSMDRPLGAEWNTRIGFQRGTLPKVVKKMGTIIDPLEKLA